jgi:hypothetical protein
MNTRWKGLGGDKLTACINISKEETLLRPKRKDKPVLLNLPKQILDEVDLAVREQGVRRSYFLRQPLSAICAIIDESNEPSSLAFIRRA